jgi:nitroimidazol reductase NimA-like FMN-containing flavoprotein (pyridoxamine 5'-phosphate oxidase superfamily)
VHNKRVVEVLSRERCEDLLSRAEIGRVVLTIQALPTALPVNFAFDGRDIVFRTGAGAKLSAAKEGTVVAFEVDDFEAALRVGWSVVATGIATAVTDPADLERVQALEIGTWVEASDTHYVRLHPEFMTGRRISIRPMAATG